MDCIRNQNFVFKYINKEIRTLYLDFLIVNLMKFLYFVKYEYTTNTLSNQ